MRIYGKALEDFSRLAKLHSHVVIERTFHRNGPREFLLDGAKRYFHPVLFFWVDSDETSARARIERMPKKGLVVNLEDGLAEREAVQKEFEPFQTEPIRFLNEGSPEESVARLWDIIKLHAGIT